MAYDTKSELIARLRELYTLEAFDEGLPEQHERMLEKINELLELAENL